jgi:hypothetical protein
VRLVSLWWDLPPQLNSKNNITLEECNSFLYFKVKNLSNRFMEIFYYVDMTGV